MPRFNKLRGIAGETYLATKVDELAAMYRKVQKELTQQLRSVNLTEFQKYRTDAVLRQVDDTLTSLGVRSRKWVKEAIPASYDRGMDVCAERLKQLKVTRYVNYDAQIHTSAVGTLIDDVTLDFLQATESIRTNVRRYIRATQQKILEEKQISKSIAEGLIKGETRKQTSDRILLQFKKRMDEERYIVINGRNYRPDKYANLLARTRTREATTSGSVNTALYYGVDLMQVDVHAGSCEYCMQFQGRVYSISGNHPYFPELVERPPYHPHCKHVLVPVTETSMQDRGTYDSLTKLSNAPTTKVDSFKRFEELVEELA